MPGTITIALDSTQPNKTTTYQIPNDVLGALAAFVRDSSGQYSGPSHLMASNLQTGLWQTLTGRYPNPTITGIQSQLTTLQAQVTALLAASNPPVTPTPDPVVVAPF